MPERRGEDRPSARVELRGGSKGRREVFGGQNVHKTYTAPTRGRRGCVHHQGYIYMTQRLAGMGLGGVEPPTSRLSGRTIERALRIDAKAPRASRLNARSQTRANPARTRHARVHNAYTAKAAARTAGTRIPAGNAAVAYTSPTVRRHRTGRFSTPLTRHGQSWGGNGGAR